MGRSSPKRIRVRPFDQSGRIFHALESRSGRSDQKSDHPQPTRPRASRTGSKIRSEIGRVKQFDHRLAAKETLQNSQQFGRAPLRSTKNLYRHNSAKNATSKRPVTTSTGPTQTPSNIKKLRKSIRKQRSGSIHRHDVEAARCSPRVQSAKRSVNYTAWGRSKHSQF